MWTTEHILNEKAFSLVANQALIYFRQCLPATNEQNDKLESRSG